MFHLGFLLISLFPPLSDYLQKLMKYYKDLHDGIIPEEDVLDDKDVADEEMAAALVFFFS